MTAPVSILDGRVVLHLGDVMEALKTFAGDSVDCVVTSPPYWGLRDYGVDGQIGLERTLGEHLDVMVGVFEEIRRVLKPEGTLWLNYGDCYASTPNGKSAADTKATGNDNRTFRDKPFSTVGPIYGADPGKPFSPSNGTKRRGSGNNPSGPVFRPDYEKTARVGRGENKGSVAAAHGSRIVAGGYLKPKDLCMIPARLAIALQEAGWWLRSEIIWAKPNPMPESVRDRPANAVEKIYLLTKSARYFYDKDAVRQGRTGTEDANGFRGGSYTNGTPSGRAVSGNKKVREVPPCNEPYSNHTKLDATGRGNGRNLRNWEPAPEADLAFPEIWEIATSPFPEAHFATFPVELAARCIKAGCPHGGLVLDPFGGAGTTALAALAHGRKAALVELKPDYAAIAETRLKKAFMGPDERRRFGATADPVAGPLFSAPGTKGAQAC